VLDQGREHRRPPFGNEIVLRVLDVDYCRITRAETAQFAGKVFREVASGAKTDRPQLARLVSELAAGDVVMVTRLDRLARSTRDLLNTLAAITDRKAGGPARRRPPPAPRR
jgi:predicted site-specific integrase-resolvase